MVLERHQGQGHVPVLAEEKLQRKEASREVVGAGCVIVQVTLGEVLGAGDRLNLSHPRDILSVDNLAADEQLDLVDDVTPVDAWDDGTGRILGNHVDGVHQVTLLLQTDRGDVASRGVTLDSLAFE